MVPVIVLHTVRPSSTAVQHTSHRWHVIILDVKLPIIMDVVPLPLQVLADRELPDGLGQVEPFLQA